MVKENKILCKLLVLATAKNHKMKEELKKAKHLLKQTSATNEKLRITNIERNTLIDNLRRELAFFEDRFYVRLGASKGHKSFCEGVLSEDILQARFLEEKEQEIQAEDDKMVNVSLLDQSNIMDISRVNKHSVMKRKRNTKGSFHILPKEKDGFFKKAASPTKTPIMSTLTPLAKLRSSQGDLQKQRSTISAGMFEFEDIDYREAFKVEEAKAYLTQLAKELMLMTNSRAKFAFSKMKNKKYIDFGTLPTPVVKVERSVSCPPLTFSRKGRVHSPKDADTTLVFDNPGMQMLGDDYSIDYDFDEFKKIMQKQA